MTHPTFQQLLEGEHLDHANSCTQCKPMLDAIAIVREPPLNKAAFERGVLAKIQTTRSPWRRGVLAAIPVIAAILIFVRTSEFTPRGGAGEPVLVELVAMDGGYGVRVKNTLEHAVKIGAYVTHKDGETTWIAPHWPEGVTARPDLIEVPAGTDLKLLDEGVKPDAPAVSLTGFAEDFSGKRVFERTTEVH